MGLGRGRDGVPPLFSTGGTRLPLPHFFGLKFVHKLVHCCNWLLTETQCKIISVQHKVRPKLFQNLCLSFVSGVPTSFLGLHPCMARPSSTSYFDLLAIGRQTDRRTENPEPSHNLLSSHRAVTRRALSCR